MLSAMGEPTQFRHVGVALEGWDDPLWRRHRIGVKGGATPSWRRHGVGGKGGATPFWRRRGVVVGGDKGAAIWFTRNRRCQARASEQ